MTDFGRTYYTTITLNNWISTFEDYPESVNLIYDSFDFMTKNNWVKIYAFVIMRDHIHVLWDVFPNRQIISVIDAFKNNTGRAISSLLKDIAPEYLNEYFSTKRKDRLYQIWKLGYGNLKITNSSIYSQKKEYIHLNPTRGNYKTSIQPHEYLHSSAKSYILEESLFSFLTLIE